MTILPVCSDRFDTYADYRAFQQEYGVSVPAYQEDLAQTLNRLPEKKHKFPVADEEEEAWYSSVYSPTEGLILDQKRGRSMQDRCL